MGLVLSAGLAAGALLLLAVSASAAGRAAAGAAPAAGAVFTTTTTFDTPDANPGDGLCQYTEAQPKCSLRAALQEIDALTSTANSIFLPDQVYTLTAAAGDLQIGNDVTLNGQFYVVAGHSQTTLITGQPGWHHRIFRVQGGADVTFFALTVTGGDLPAGNGGGINVVSGTLTLIFDTVTGNTAGNGGGIYNSGLLSAIGTSISANHALTQGGGIYNNGLSSLASLNAVRVVSNTSAKGGGGVYNSGVLATFFSTFQGNTALSGAGLANAQDGVATIEQSAVLSNTAVAGPGGGVQNVGLLATTTLVNSTVADNHDLSVGAGVANSGGFVRLYNATVAHNTDDTTPGGGAGLYASSATSFTLANSLVALNVDNAGHPADCQGTFNSAGFNLVQSTCTLTSPIAANLSSNILGKDPQLQPLASNSGTTFNFALGFNSPAIDKGNPAGCRTDTVLLVTDQRVAPRPADGDGDGIARCDIGAYELQLARLFLPLLER